MIGIGDTIAEILERPEYQGHTVNFKTYKQSYKSKKTCYNPEEKWLVFENTHEAIIDADTWATGTGITEEQTPPDEDRKDKYVLRHCRAVLTAAKSCITAQARTLKQGKTISYVQLQGSKGKRFARRILSALWYWNRAYLPTCRLTIACVANHEEQFRKAMGAKQKAEAKERTCGKAATTDTSGTAD